MTDKISKKELKVAIAIFSSIVALILIALFLPLIYAKSFAQKDIKNVLEDKTQTIEKNIWGPKYAFFSSDDQTYSSQVNFVKLERKNIFWWKVKTHTNEKFLTPEGLTNEERENLNEENLKALENAVENGSLTDGRYAKNQDLTNIWSEDYNTPGKVINEFVNPINNSEIQIVNSLEKYGKEVIIDGQKTGIKNVYSLNYEYDPIASNIENLYYTKYDIDGENIYYTGKIYRYNINDNQEQEVFDFEKQGIISLQATKNYILYGFAGGEVGIIDLKANNARKIVTTLEMFGASDDFVPSPKVLDISDTSGVIKTDDLESFEQNKNKYLMVDLVSGEFTVEWSE